MPQCMFPFHAKRNVYHRQEDATVPVPCGKCPNCLQARSSRWGFRLLNEQKRAITTHFITLTYDTHNVPISDNGFMTLDFSDVQKYFKRIRKQYGKKQLQTNPLRYYCAGEYGTKNYRPHYHIILFNGDVQTIVKQWKNPHTGNPLGEVHIGHDCSGAAIQYTLKYINKGKIIPMHKNDDRVPERALMSKGLGTNYLSKSMIQFHRENLDKAYSTIEGGIKVPLSRYYKDKIFPTTTTRYELVKNHPSILIHFEENTLLRKEQENFVKSLHTLSVQTLSDKDQHEAKRIAIQQIQNHQRNKRS